MLKSFILNSRGRQGESLDGGTADSDSLAVSETAFTPGSMPSFGGDSRTAPTPGRGPRYLEDRQYSQSEHRQCPQCREDRANRQRIHWRDGVGRDDDHQCRRDA